MLTITIPGGEVFNEATNEFINLGEEKTITLEHSLVSVSKWEAKYHKPFISDEKKTNEELIDYIRFMTITQNVDPKIYERLTVNNYKEVNKYIEDTMTATTFTKYTNGKIENEKVVNKKQIITSELIYYWMIAYQIPSEYQKWHLNRLLTLIRICNIKNNTNDKMSKKDLYANNRALNAARRAKLNTKG